MVPPYIGSLLGKLHTLDKVDLLDQLFHSTKFEMTSLAAEEVVLVTELF